MVTFNITTPHCKRNNIYLRDCVIILSEELAIYGDENMEFEVHNNSTGEVILDFTTNITETHNLHQLLDLLPYWDRIATL